MAMYFNILCERILKNNTLDILFLRLKFRAAQHHRSAVNDPSVNIVAICWIEYRRGTSLYVLQWRQRTYFPPGPQYSPIFDFIYRVYSTKLGILTWETRKVSAVYFFWHTYVLKCVLCTLHVGERHPIEVTLNIVHRKTRSKIEISSFLSNFLKT